MLDLPGMKDEMRRPMMLIVCARQEMTAGGSAADTAYRGQKALLHALLCFSGGKQAANKRRGSGTLPGAYPRLFYALLRRCPDFSVSGMTSRAKYPLQFPRYWLSFTR